MTTKHPYHDIIVAYLEGKVIEVMSNDHWVAIPSLGEKSFVLPTFNPHTEYRVKPPENKFERRIDLSSHDGLPRMRRAEHWEKPNVSIVFDRETHKLVSVEMI